MMSLTQELSYLDILSPKYDLPTYIHKNIFTFSYSNITTKKKKPPSFPQILVPGIVLGITVK